MKKLVITLVVFCFLGLTNCKEENASKNEAPSPTLNPHPPSPSQQKLNNQPTLNPHPPSAPQQKTSSSNNPVSSPPPSTPKCPNAINPDACTRSYDSQSTNNNQPQNSPSQVGQYGKGAIQYGKDVGSKVWEKTKEGTGNAWESTKEGTGNAWESTKEGTGNLWEKTKEAPGNLWEKTKEGYDEAKEGGSGNTNYPTHNKPPCEGPPLACS